MPTYTFYPYAEAGTALMFEVLDLPDDSAAVTHAERLLTLHASAAEVVVWEDDRQVHRETRAQVSPREACDQPRAPGA